MYIGFIGNDEFMKVGVSGEIVFNIQIIKRYHIYMMKTNSFLGLYTVIL